MHSPEITAALNLGAAWLAGSLIGAERSFNGRAAGFRTHALVSLASAAVVSLALQPALMPGVFSGPAGQLDTSRLAQGVMTGVGFLGAGVIFKEGVSVQGLTTAACIWTTAAIGLLFGAGMTTLGSLVTAGVLVTLIGLRVVERAIPQSVFALAVFRFQADNAPGEGALADLLGRGEAQLREFSYGLTHDGSVFEYRVNLQVRTNRELPALVERARALPGLVEFDIARISK